MIEIDFFSKNFYKDKTKFLNFVVPQEIRATFFIFMLKTYIFGYIFKIKRYTDNFRAKLGLEYNFKH